MIPPKTIDTLIVLALVAVLAIAIGMAIGAQMFLAWLTTVAATLFGLQLPFWPTWAAIVVLTLLTSSIAAVLRGK